MTNVPAKSESPANVTGSRIPVLIDCDPGHDDAIALMLAFGSGCLDVLGVTTVAGNGEGADTYRNARKILKLLGADVPVARGSDCPLIRRLVTAPSVHGATALDGPKLPEVHDHVPQIAAIDLIGQVLTGPHDLAVKDGLERTAGRKIVWIATGPLTNVAIALLARPGIKENLERIVLMGGAVGAGNRTPSAEFNIHVDPEAAKVVFNSGVPLTMIGLDVTHKALVYPNEVENLRIAGRVGKIAAELLDFYSRFYRGQGFKGNPIHDAVAVAHVIDGSLVATRRARVEVEIHGEFTAGRTVADLSPEGEATANCDVGLDIDREAFVGLLHSAIRSLV
jgi:pyrimidine-specific ribonucleoside hydrolase